MTVHEARDLMPKTTKDMTDEEVQIMLDKHRKLVHAIFISLTDIMRESKNKLPQ